MSEFFSPRYSQNSITMTNSFHRLTKPKYFFKNQGIFFGFDFKETGSTPPRYLRPIVTQEIHTSH